MTYSPTMDQRCFFTVSPGMEPVSGRVVAIHGKEVLFKEWHGHKWEHTFSRRKDGTYRKVGQRKGYQLYLISDEMKKITKQDYVDATGLEPGSTFYCEELDEWCTWVNWNF